MKESGNDNGRPRGWRVIGPSGPMYTVAKTKAKAKANFRYRLAKEHGMSWYQASQYDLSDTEETVI